MNMKKEISENELYRRIKKYDIPCLYYQIYPYTDYEDGCEYGNNTDCQNCICHGGSINPETGKRVYKRRSKT